MTATPFEFNTALASPVSLRRDVTIGRRRCFLIRLVTSDGHEGWGEASPLPGFSRETVEDLMSDFVRMRGRVCGAHVADREDRNSILRSFAGTPSLQFGLATALGALDEATRKPRYDLPSRIPTAKLLSTGQADLIESALSAARSGFVCLKVKVGRRDPVTEAAEVAALIDALDPDVSIRLDANRAWTLPQATTFLSSLELASIEFIEEPLRDPDDIDELVRRTGARVAADESVLEGNLDSVVFNEFICAVVLKPTLTGVDVVDRVQTLSQDVAKALVFSCCYESGVGTAAVARLARKADASVAAGLGTHALLVDDVLQPPVDFGGPFVDFKGGGSGVVRVDVDRLTAINLG